MKKHTTKIVFAGLFLLAACASKVTKYNYPSNSDPTRVISDLHQEIYTDAQEQADVFAKDSYEEAHKHLDKAEKLQNSGAKQEKVLDEAGLAKAYSTKAQEETERNKPLLNSVADARERALASGAATTQPKELRKIDDDFVDYVKKAVKGKDTPEKTADFQRRYSDLELGTITQSRLGRSQQWLKQAKDLGAEKVAPQSYADAKEAYNNARLVIATNRYDEEAISTAVDKSEANSAYALEVTQEVKKSDIPESVAVDIVNKRHDIARLRQRMGESRQVNAQLRNRNEQFMMSARINEMIDQAQGAFDKDDAEVYRQGNDLLFRLKTVKFTSGKTDIPAGALPVLGKVKEVIQDLRATKVVVEGHTDSTGSTALNKKLSQARAEAVADYLSSDGAVDPSIIEAVGYGDSRPLASNRTKEGRAQNRRVDIVVTPGLSESTLGLR
jgi:outer membrane protein OmpA-like peptidoglycan-associated protein